MGLGRGQRSPQQFQGHIVVFEERIEFPGAELDAVVIGGKPDDGVEERLVLERKLEEGPMDERIPARFHEVVVEGQELAVVIEIELEILREMVEIERLDG